MKTTTKAKILELLDLAEKRIAERDERVRRIKRGETTPPPIKK
jgi:hypothetical protein